MTENKTIRIQHENISYNKFPYHNNSNNQPAAVPWFLELKKRRINAFEMDTFPPLISGVNSSFDNSNSGNDHNNDTEFNIYD